MAIKRQNIVNQLKSQLQNITVANGYYTNLGDNVKLFSVIPVEENELPCVVIFDKMNNFASESFTNSANIFYQSLEVVLNIVCGGNTVDTVARQLIIDVYKAIGSDTTLGGYAIDIIPINDELDIEQESKLIASIKINLNILYRTERFNES